MKKNIFLLLLMDAFALHGFSQKAYMDQTLAINADFKQFSQWKVIETGQKEKKID